MSKDIENHPVFAALSAESRRTIAKNAAPIERDSLAIRNGLLDHARDWENTEVEVINRNSFCLRLDPEGPIFTVTVSYGGSLRTKS